MSGTRSTILIPASVRISTFRVVSQQAYFIHAQQLKHIRTQREIALIGSEAELVVCFYRVVPWSCSA